MLTEVLAQADKPAETGQVAWAVGIGYGAAAVTMLLGLAEIARRIMRALDRRIATQAAGMARVEKVTQAAAAAVRTSNGHTAGELVEETAAQVREIRDGQAVLTEWAGENRNMILEAKVAAERAAEIAKRAEDKIDAHLIGHKGD